MTDKIKRPSLEEVRKSLKGARIYYTGACDFEKPEEANKFTLDFGVLRDADAEKYSGWGNGPLAPAHWFHQFYMYQPDGNGRLSIKLLIPEELNKFRSEVFQISKPGKSIQFRYKWHRDTFSGDEDDHLTPYLTARIEQYDRSTLEQVVTAVVATAEKQGFLEHKEGTAPGKIYCHGPICESLFAASCAVNETDSKLADKLCSFIENYTALVGSAISQKLTVVRRKAGFLEAKLQKVQAQTTLL